MIISCFDFFWFRYVGNFVFWDLYFLIFLDFRYSGFWEIWDYRVLRFGGSLSFSDLQTMFFYSLIVLHFDIVNFSYFDILEFVYSEICIFDMIRVSICWVSGILRFSDFEFFGIWVSGILIFREFEIVWLWDLGTLRFRYFDMLRVCVLWIFMTLGFEFMSFSDSGGLRFWFFWNSIFGDFEIFRCWNLILGDFEFLGFSHFEMITRRLYKSGFVNKYQNKCRHLPFSNSRNKLSAQRRAKIDKNQKVSDDVPSKIWNLQT